MKKVFPFSAKSIILFMRTDSREGSCLIPFYMEKIRTRRGERYTGKSMKI